MVTRDVIDIDPTNRLATITADLRRAEGIPAATFDCVILTQTLHVIDDMAAVLAECGRILRPGGVLLLTAPSVSKVDPESGLDGDFWRLTEASARKLFAAVFPIDAFEVTAYGNIKACTAFFTGSRSKRWRQPISITVTRRSRSSSRFARSSPSHRRNGPWNRW